MIQRCTNPKHPSYTNYGGRGIKICKEWFAFKNFLSDMGERPNTSLTLERINNDGDYEPSNCKWATRTEQLRNKRFPKHGYRSFAGKKHSKKSREAISNTVKELYKDPVYLSRRREACEKRWGSRRNS
jgi:hypothetical protein